MLGISFINLQKFDWNHDGVFNRSFLDRFSLIPTDSNPDILIYSFDGNYHTNKHNNYSNCIKIFYSGENMHVAPYNTYLQSLKDGHYAITPNHFNHKRHFRMPNYIRKHGYTSIKILQDIELQNETIDHKDRFCAFISSHHTLERSDMFCALNAVKKVDSFGSVFNNMGLLARNRWHGNIELLKRYRFNICFENSKAPGYSTEKIYEAMLAGCIPIYWGDPQITQEYNADAILRKEDFNSYEELVGRIFELECNRNQYLEFAKRHFLIGGKCPAGLEESSFFNFFESILDNM